MHSSRKFYWYVYMIVTEFQPFRRALTARLNEVKSDACMGAPTPAKVSEAQITRTGKPETASPAVKDPRDPPERATKLSPLYEQGLAWGQQAK